MPTYTFGSIPAHFDSS